MDRRPMASQNMERRGVALDHMVSLEEFKAAFRARHADASGTESVSGPNVDFE